MATHSNGLIFVIVYFLYLSANEQYDAKEVAEHSLVDDETEVADGMYLDLSWKDSIRWRIKERNQLIKCHINVISFNLHFHHFGFNCN